MNGWAIFGAAANWSKGSSRMSTEEMTEQVLTVILEGASKLVSER
ncbi:hypothetical protein [Paenibacillus cisolokensis]|nr:hypothetical protein [Paenibacillus cisolokensis]